MKKIKNQPEALEGIVMGAMFNLFVLLFTLPLALLFFFFTIFIVFDFSTAKQYTLPAAIVTSALCSLGINLVMDISPRTKSVYAGIIISLVAVYLVTLEIETKSQVEQPVLTAEERKRIALDSECYDIGRSYGITAISAYKGNTVTRDVVIPFRCRNRASTSRGIRAGTSQ